MQDQLQAQHEPFVFDAVPVNAVHAVASTVRHQWGESGYRMTLEPRWTFYSRGPIYESDTFYVFGIRHADGSEFYLCADRWENVYEANWNGECFTKGARV